MRVPRLVLLVRVPNVVFSLTKLHSNGNLQGSQYTLFSHAGSGMSAFSALFALCALLIATCLPPFYYFRHVLCLCRCFMWNFPACEWNLCNYYDKSVHFCVIPSARASHHGSLRRCIQISSPFYQLYAMTQSIPYPNGTIHFNFLRTLHSRDQ
jgi:hypothetical protein